MTVQELDEVYTALSENLALVGKEVAPLMLAMLCLSLIVDRDDANEMILLIERVQRLSLR